MPTRERIAALKSRLTALEAEAAQYFEGADFAQSDDEEDEPHWAVEAPDRRGEPLRENIKSLGVDVAGAARGSALVAEADLHDFRHNIRKMLASVGFRRYRYSGVHVHSYEDVVLGVDPPSQREEPLDDPRAASAIFAAAASAVRDLIDFLSPSESGENAGSETSKYRPNTAFIMMPIDKGRHALQDIKAAIVDVCAEFGIVAVTADDIEHDGPITDRILEEIETNEFLLADLTLERPNVYYEVGHAHARNKRVILFRGEGTKVHFDLSHRNCPEYQNAVTLKNLLRKRLEALTNKPRKK